MNKTLNKTFVTVAMVATAWIGFAQTQEVVCDHPIPPAKMDKCACQQGKAMRGHTKMGKQNFHRKDMKRAPFDKETFALIKAYREDASEANLVALKAKLESNYDERVARQQAMVDEMKTNREKHIEAMLKHMTEAKDKAPAKCGEHAKRGPRPEGAPEAAPTPVAPSAE